MRYHRYLPLSFRSISNETLLIHITDASTLHSQNHHALTHFFLSEMLMESLSLATTRAGSIRLCQTL